MERGGVAPRILNIGTRLRWVVSFTPRPLYPVEIIYGNHWIWGRVGHRVGLDVVARRKIPPQVGNRTPIVQPVA